jgi:Fe-S cluster assembly protein SufD
LAKDARGIHAKLIHEANKEIHLGKLSVWQHENSHLLSQSLVVGGALVRSDTDTRLIEKSSTCELNGLYLAHEKNHIDHHTKIHHQGTSTESKQYYKGVVDAYGHAVFNGKVLIDPFASKTRAQQMNKNLLLSDTGEIDTKPQLEIYTDDVQCTHGATVGKLDENALFYIQSRGLSLNDARRLLLLAFIQELFNRMPEFSTLIDLPLFLEKFLSYA